MKFVNLIIKLC